MKKSSCLFVALSSVFLLAAQETNFGLKAGLNIAGTNVSPGADHESKAGFHIGGLAHIHLNRNFALQPELVYSTQGGTRDEDVEIKLNYINIPLLIQYMTQHGLRLQTGPQLGLLTTAKRETGDVEVNIKDDFKSTDFSWVFGLGYLFPGGFGIDGRYNLGVSNVWDASATKIKNSVFQIGIFYQFMQGNTRRK